MGRDLALMLDLLTYTQGADVAIEVLCSIWKVVVLTHVIHIHSLCVAVTVRLPESVDSVPGR